MSDPEWIKKTVSDIVRAAKACGVHYNEDSIEKSVRLYEPQLKKGYVQFRVTNKPLDKGRELNFRYQCRPGQKAPWVFAREHGFTTAPEADTVMEETWAAMPTARECVDFELKSGVTKVWHMHEGLQTLSAVRSKIPSLPPAVDNYIETFKKFGLDDVFTLTGLDRRHPSFNLYFGIRENLRSLDYYRSLAHTLGFTYATDEQLRFWPEWDTIATTFRWNSDKIDRICFYRKITHNPRGEDPVIDEMLDKGLPTTQAEPYYSYGYTFTQTGMYVKLEWDYIRSLHDFELEVAKDFVHVYWQREVVALKDKLAAAQGDEAAQLKLELDTAQEKLQEAKLLAEESAAKDL